MDQKKRNLVRRLAQGDNDAYEPLKRELVKAGDFKEVEDLIVKYNPIRSPKRKDLESNYPDILKNPEEYFMSNMKYYIMGVSSVVGGSVAYFSNAKNSIPIFESFENLGIAGMVMGGLLLVYSRVKGKKCFNRYEKFTEDYQVVMQEEFQNILDVGKEIKEAKGK